VRGFLIGGGDLLRGASCNGQCVEKALKVHDDGFVVWRDGYLRVRALGDGDGLLLADGAA